MTYEERIELSKIIRGFDKIYLEALLMANIEERFNWDAGKIKEYLEEKVSEIKEIEEKYK